MRAMVEFGWNAIKLDARDVNCCLFTAAPYHRLVIHQAIPFTRASRGRDRLNLPIHGGRKTELNDS